jgi:hypothetical protein
MTKEEKIKKILDDASLQIMTVLKGEEKSLTEAYENIDATANKILSDSFDMKTLTVDQNNIDVSRYEMLEFLPDEDIINLYHSCKRWIVSKENDATYMRFCGNMAQVQGTTLQEEIEKNVNSIIFKYKQINVNNTRSSNGEIEAKKV